MKKFYQTQAARLLVFFILLTSGWSLSIAQTALPAPTNLSATAPSYNEVVLKWTDNSGELETGFEIYRDPGLGTDFQLIATTAKNATSYSDKTVAANTLYNYRIRATNTRQQSLPSSDVSVTTRVAPPSAPGNLATTLINSNTIRLTWDGNNSGGTTFYVERMNRSGGGSFTQIAVVNYSRTLVYDDAGLATGTDFCYRVRAHNESGESGYSNTSCANTPQDTPTAPGRLTATAVSAGQIDLSWADISDNETGFEVERGSSENGTFAKIADLGANSSTYSDQNLSSQTTYCYRIRAKNASGNSGYASPVCATTKVPTITIPRPSGLLTAAAVSPNQINLAWEDNADNEDGFELERSTDGVGFSKITDLGANVTSYQNTDLNASTKYYYRIRAKNSAGFSAYSNVADASTYAPAVTIPRPPGSLTASAVSPNQINLTWMDNADNEDGFELERSTDGVGFSKITDLGANTTFYQNTGLSASTKYYYRIRSKNSAGFSGYSNVADATTGEVAPDAPQRLTATAVSTSQINLSWADISANETGFELERSTDGASYTKLIDLSPNTTSYQNTGLNAFTRYWYRIRTKNAVGNSGYSNVADATTFDTPPTAPVELAAAVISSSQINLSWKDQSANETGFEIERSTDGASFSKIAEVSANTTTYQNTGLSPATHYYFRVRAVNSANPSDFSNVAEATTVDVAPIPPARLAANAVSYQQIDLSWADISTNETSFELERSMDGTTFSKITDLPANASTFQDKAVLSLTKYFYRIRAVNKIGFSAYSNTAEATTPRAPIPDKPQNLVATPVDFDLIQLNWTALSENATNVIIERSQKPDADFVQIGAQNASIIQFPDHEILDVNDYYYRIKAVNAAGESPYSEVAKVPASAIITGTEPSQTENLVYAADKTLFVKITKPGKYKLTLLDLNGKILTVLAANQTTQTDLSVLSSGIYIVLIESEKQIVTQKIVLY
ncbi:fibronectin type III domain-containing protein [Dyadobacter subterraneus]|uniref:Fibronectin type III domain-containing protein n=1 Tax=Dyadobacter subterraneus TaxID=2773304 RepID=A0ABR9WEZ1_9BACT|nr:fibronectin type III domain-containing protein [Dyadobacter subterraneus]MBE9463997.1 fibronectin type III domain-containing protein [Dyadobacter subterraneus]